MWVKAKPTDLRVRQNVIMHGNMEVLVNMVMDKVSMPDRGVLGLGVRLVFLRESREALDHLVGLTILQLWAPQVKTLIT